MYTTARTPTNDLAARSAGMADAILCRMSPRTQVSDAARQYLGMSVLELGRENLEAHGVSTRNMSRFELGTAMLQFRSGMGTSDFVGIMSNVSNKRLRQAYDEAKPSYRTWARRGMDAPDFKPITTVQLSGAPDLLQTNEHGEFKYGRLLDGKETYQLITYGRIVSLTRQAIVNDDLRGFDRLVAGYGNSAARLENRLVYAILTGNPTLADGGALFNATAVSTPGGHANLGSGGGSALQASSLATGRTAMRVQKGLQSEELSLAPGYLICPAALEQTAYQLTSANYTPATASAINEFRAGGRTALEPVIESLLDGASTTAWYLAARASQVDTVEFCYLDGQEGPVVETELGFDVDGIAYKARLDFAAKAIDFRGLYKSAGA